MWKLFKRNLTDERFIDDKWHFYAFKFILTLIDLDLKSFTQFGYECVALNSIPVTQVKLNSVWKWFLQKIMYYIAVSCEKSRSFVFRKPQDNSTMNIWWYNWLFKSLIRLIFRKKWQDKMHFMGAAITKMVGFQSKIVISARRQRISKHGFFGIWNAIFGPM